MTTFLDCPALSVTDGTVPVQHRALAQPLVTSQEGQWPPTANGYELVGEENRTCPVDGTWTGAEPQCTG